MGPANFRGCHVLFVSESEQRQPASIVQASQAALLTVNDIDGFIDMGGGIGLVVPTSGFSSKSTSARCGGQPEGQLAVAQAGAQQRQLAGEELMFSIGKLAAEEAEPPSSWRRHWSLVGQLPDRVDQPARCPAQADLSQLEGYAEIISANSAAAIASMIGRPGRRPLSSLRNRSDIVAAWISLPDGRLFAAYPNADPAAQRARPPAADHLQLQDIGFAREITVNHPIFEDHETVGYLTLRVDLSAMCGAICCASSRCPAPEPIRILSGLSVLASAAQ
ncbi:MAG: DUF4154 domain-containing protein [Sterolibacteriaceae bacterium]|nr:DUF4154 domain-containing protein [Sterolibacteriaceae bacterium]